MLARITGRSFREEARPATTSFDLVLSIRRRRLRWLGHILRAGDHRLVFKAIVVQAEMGRQGNMWMDSPAHNTMTEVMQLAADKAVWKKMCKELK